MLGGGTMTGLSGVIVVLLDKPVAVKLLRRFIAPRSVAWGQRAPQADDG